MKRAILLALVVALAGCNKQATNSPSASAKTAPTAGVNLAYVDKTVRPGDDFDAYANGAWRKKAEIPPDRSAIGAGLDMVLLAEKRTAELIGGIAKSKPPAGSDEARIADDYAAYMDEAGIEKRGLAAAKPMLDEIAAIKDKSALSRRLGAGVRADTDPINATDFQTENLFGVFVSQTGDDPSHYTAYLLQGGLGLPGRDYYLSTDKEMVKLRDAYRAYVGDMLSLMGRKDAQAAADRIIALESKIAQAHASFTDGQNFAKANNPWAMADFVKKAPGLDWPAFFEGAQLAGQPRLIVWQPSGLIGESKLVASEPLEVWKDWLAFHLVSQYAEFLPKAFADRNFGFYGETLSGTPVQLPREKRALNVVNAQLGDAVGKRYVAKYFPASSKAEIEGMVKNITSAFDQRVAKIDWMADSTKAEARRKIATLIVGVGYPETWRDYSRLTIKRDDPFGNAWRARLYEYQHQLSKLGRPVDRHEWWMTPQTVNAINMPLQNALNFPAAILEAPSYDAKADAAAKYGAIGATIGHEVSHSFDSLGASFDADGRYRDWWTPQDRKRFQAAGQALVKQYDAYEPLPGLHVNGKQTLGENIADVAGLSAAYDAYHAALGGKSAPVIDGLTGDQRFFLAFAQSWRQKIREERLKQQIRTNEHAPSAARVDTVRNIDAWYDAFGIKPGDKLYLAPKDRVRVWG
ncbi:MAG TPA: M13 family metallopeptidase [Caulobacteraceae bacterium]|nr:M13 family metallopeptidase [Caulobacteraceae bacterium]